jgi:hypothetical protein
VQVVEAVESGRKKGAWEEFALAGSSAQARLEDQIAWYDAKSGHNQGWFKLLKVCQADGRGRGADRGPRGASAAPDALLAERVEGLVSQEHAAWVSHREDEDRQMGGRG